MWVKPGRFRKKSKMTILYDKLPWRGGRTVLLSGLVIPKVYMLK